MQPELAVVAYAGSYCSPFALLVPRCLGATWHGAGVEGRALQSQLGFQSALNLEHQRKELVKKIQFESGVIGRKVAPLQWSVL